MTDDTQKLMDEAMQDAQDEPTTVAESEEVFKETPDEKAEEVAQESQEEPEPTATELLAEEKAETPAETPEPAEEVSEAVEEPKEEPVAPTQSTKSLNEDKKAEPVFTNVPDNAKWYIVHTYAGHENKVSKALRQRAETMGFADKIFDIIVPTREVTKVAGGKKSQVQEKIFPGYVIVRMVLTDESWILVRTTPGVTAFIGAGNKPTPISEKEVEAIQKFMKVEEPLFKASFVVGEAVKIVDGPFSDFLGTIDSIDEGKGKVRVLVSIFGRETPVELDFLQVSKI